MGFDFGDRAKEDRDRRLRASLLRTAYNARTSPTGGISGRTLIVVVSADTAAEMGFEDDAHAVALLRDLRSKGLLDLVADKQRRLHQGEKLSPDHLALCITDKGSMLVREQIPADPDVWDQRQEIE
jgi:hypothetical protein